MLGKGIHSRLADGLDFKKRALLIVVVFVVVIVPQPPKFGIVCVYSCVRMFYLSTVVVCCTAAPTLRALSSLLDPSVGIIAPPSTRAILEASPMFHAKSHHAAVEGNLFLRNGVGAGDDLAASPYI